jgi:hypothetical protein
MGQARPDLISAYWDNPPGPRQGLTLVREINGRRYTAYVPATGSLTQIETAAVLGMHLMSVNRMVRSGKLKDHEVRGKSMIRLSEIKRVMTERSGGKRPRLFLTG